MSEPISTIKTATEIIKPDSASEILALQNSSDTRLQNAGHYEADTKQKIAEAKNLLVTLVHLGLVSPIKMTKGAIVKIVESFSLHSESTKQAINQKIESLKNQGILSSKISSIPAFADMAERLVYLDEEPDLKQMFEDLLISTIDSTKTNINHPAYVEILKQINNQEAKKLKLLFEQVGIGIPICNINFITNDQGHYQITQQYMIPSTYNDITQKELENWERLKLIIINMETYWTNDKLYSYAQNIVDEANKTAISPHKFELTKGQLTFTEFGKNFAKAIGII